MSEQLARQIIDNYVTTTLALRASNKLPTSETGMETYRSERLDIFIRWENAKFSLQELPNEYKLQAIQAIEQITA
ncbi:hypothetical protein [Paenibacillus xylanexedens]|uniref:hypothetical protein n=1 Tax=Paenibacillus xylanexedens TaxID=528191 RepID=UPI001C8D0420|nr:hypothetical protein [Paenibacillus xylanexedens]MBY0117896.1 hypothetical protein [Paenibacillus xylanexedens]